MLSEISDIQRFLAKKFNLKLEGEGFNTRVVGTVPDGTYEIPLGRKKNLYSVRIVDGRIFIDAQLTDGAGK